VVRAPWIERQLAQTITPELEPVPVVAADPIAIMLALILLRVKAAVPVKRAVGTVFQPASEYGQKGMDELHEQTVNLLSFQQLPKDIFDVQVAFNLVSRYGEKAISTLSSVSDRIVRHYKKITAGQAPIPSMQILHAPIFHGNAVSLNLQLESAADIAQISSALAGEHISMTPSSEDAPSNVNAAGQGDILVALTPDNADPNSVWLWATSDNLRVAASIGVELAESMAAARPRGKIQCFALPVFSRWFALSAPGADTTPRAAPTCCLLIFAFSRFLHSSTRRKLTKSSRCSPLQWSRNLLPAPTIT
jgi:aspartate-semialdehyde dehydrogenase